MQTPPDQLEGLDALWRIATESTGKQVIDAAAKLLVQVHHEMSSALRPRVAEFDDMFITRCFDIIAAQLPLIRDRPSAELDAAIARVSALRASATQIMILKHLPLPERRIIRSLFLLRQLIRASEKGGTHGVRPHHSLAKGSVLPTIQITNNLTTSTITNSRSRIEIAISNSATLWDLKKVIAREVRKTSQDGGKTYGVYPNPPSMKIPPLIHPGTIRVFQLSATKDVPDGRNGDTLRDIGFTRNEALSVYRKSALLTRRAQLMVDDEKTGEAVWTPRALEVLEEVYQEYSYMSEEHGRRVMGKAECAKYTEACTGTTSAVSDPRVANFMNKFAFIGAKDDKSGEAVPPQEAKGEQKDVVEVEPLADLNGFLAFARNAVLTGKEDRLRANLRKLGYSSDLTRLPADGEEENCMQVRPSLAAMPRYKIAQRKYFDTLMSIMDVPHDLLNMLSQRTLELVNICATQPQLYDQILGLKSADSFDWSQIFGAKTSAYSTLYTLEIIEAILAAAKSDDDPEEKQRTQWIAAFVKFGGVEELQK